MSYTAPWKLRLQPLEQTANHFCSECEAFLKLGKKRTKCHSSKCLLIILCFYASCHGLFECLTISITGKQRRPFTNKKNNQDQSSVFSHKGKGEVTIFFLILFQLALTCQALLCPHYPIHVEGKKVTTARVTEGTRIHTIRAWVCVYLVFTAQLPLPIRPVCWSVDCLRSPEWELWTPIRIGAQWWA